MANPASEPLSHADGQSNNTGSMNMLGNANDFSINSMRVVNINGPVYSGGPPLRTRGVPNHARRPGPYDVPRTPHSETARGQRRRVARRLLQPIYRTLDTFGGGGPSRVALYLPQSEFGRLRGNGCIDVEHFTTAEVYAFSMLRSGRGLACWRPEPTGVIEGVRGVTPGDVGIYSDEGGFDVIFNLWGDEDSIRRTGETVRSQPIYSAPQKHTRKRDEELQKDHIVAQGLTSRKVPHRNGRSCASFEFNYSEPSQAGAVLIATSPAELERLNENATLKNHILNHAALLYQHANSIRCISEEEALYIITGCIKSESWAMASFTHPMAAPRDTLTLVNLNIGIDGGQVTPSYIPEYTWTEMGTAEAHCSSPRNRNGVGPPMNLKDQSLFLRGFKLDFSHSFRSRNGLRSGARSPDPGNNSNPGPESRGPPGERDRGPNDNGRGNPTLRDGGSGASRGGGGSMGRSYHLNVGHTLPGSHTPVKNEERDRVSSPPRHHLSCHPSDLINKWLFKKTGADFALCHDESWMSLLDESLTLPSESLQDPLDDNIDESVWKALEEECFTIENGVAVFSAPWTDDSNPGPSRPIHNTPCPTAPLAPTQGAPEEQTLQPAGARCSPSDNDIEATAIEPPLQTKEPTAAHRMSDGRVADRAPRPEPPPSPAPEGDPTISSGIVILVMGQTGAGKSHFINSAAGAERAHVNHHLSTSDFKIRSYTIDNPKLTDRTNPHSKIVLVETPGLNNASKEHTDLEIVKRIGTWLNNRCTGNLRVGGIIFIHDITEDRATTYAEAHAWPLKYLKSPALLEHIVLTTGKWNLGFVQNEKGSFLDRERNLKDMASWKKLLDQGAGLSQYEGNSESAWTAINTLLEKPIMNIQLLRKDFDEIQAKLPKPKRSQWRGLWSKFKNLFSKVLNA